MRSRRGPVRRCAHQKKFWRNHVLFPTIAAKCGMKKSTVVGEEFRMAKCAYCSTTIIFGGKSEGKLRFCNDQCRNKGVLLATSEQVPVNVIQQKACEIRQGNCPKCGARGPIDVHVSYQVWSAVFLTSWKSRPHVCCRSCGIKSQLGDAAFSLLLGWWGFPWGLIFTPIQVVRNMVGLARGVDPSKPSAQLEKIVRLTTASQLIQTN